MLHTYSKHCCMVICLSVNVPLSFSCLQTLLWTRLLESNVESVVQIWRGRKSVILEFRNELSVAHNCMFLYPRQIPLHTLRRNLGRILLVCCSIFWHFPCNLERLIGACNLTVFLAVYLSKNYSSCKRL